ncbi:radical SAM domain protein [Dictyocaulus viviparus]|uniref:Radical SAM domain protein n=1 Tax=Dictyocaulus viviparus TaxID=29172 RepID=A0A0D8XIQ3_DICVI|nr:radical SAM domain protein [Dictyocaulus viviparus]
MDTYGRTHNYLRISLTEKCNLRCLYCMPEDGVSLSPEFNLLTSNEIIRLVELFASHGVDKVRLTGGEPTIRKDIVELVNISLDTLDQHKYMLMTRRNGFAKVMKCIELAEMLFPIVKVNTVVMKNVNDNEVSDFVRLTENRRLDVRFIEYMPFGGNHFSQKKFVDYKTLLIAIEKAFDGLVLRLPDAANDTSKGYKINGFVGRFGFITSMSEHFCATCNRLRLTADGNLKSSVKLR